VDGFEVRIILPLQLVRARLAGGLVESLARVKLHLESRVRTGGTLGFQGNVSAQPFGNAQVGLLGLQRSSQNTPASDLSPDGQIPHGSIPPVATTVGVMPLRNTFPSLNPPMVR
jgi:hypothetical protein